MDQFNMLSRMQMAQSSIELKGSSFTLTVLHIHDEDPEAIKKAIQEKIDQAPEFLRNAPVVFNVTGLLNANTILSCYKIISEAGLKIVGVSGCTNTKLRQAITDIGLPLLSEGQNQKTQRVSVKTNRLGYSGESEHKCHKLRSEPLPCGSVLPSF